MQYIWINRDYVLTRLKNIIGSPNRFMYKHANSVVLNLRVDAATSKLITELIK